MLLLFSKLKIGYFSEIGKIILSLSHATLKYLVCYQVIQDELRRLQDQCNSLWVLVFNYCVSNYLQRKDTVMQT